MTQHPHDPGDREVLTGRVIRPPAEPGRSEDLPGDAADAPTPGPGRNGRRTASMVAGDLAGAAGARARQVSELLAGTARVLAGVLGASGIAGGLAALLITAMLAPAYDWSAAATVAVLVVLAVPTVEVLVHRALLLSTYGDAARLRRRFTDLPDATVGRVQDFTGRLRGLGGADAGGQRVGRRWFGAARSANALRGVASAVPELTGVLLLPLTKALLAVTAVCALLCWALLVLTPVAALVALVGVLGG